jgi:hypothetical protein
MINYGHKEEKKYIRRLLSFGVLQRVFCQECTEVSEDFDACVIRVDEIQ